MSRVVDPTDLTALIVLPLAWFNLRVAVKTINFSPYLRNFSPYFSAVAAFFAFCATSQPRYVQTFDQPQYVLFKSNVLPDSSYDQDDFEVYKFDSLLVIELKQSITTTRPVREDDFNKNLIVKNLDKDIFKQIPGIKSLMPSGRVTFLTIKNPHYEDSLRFKGGRLDGKFIRKSGNQVLIEGIYKNGIEDSIWIYRDPERKTLTKKTFVNGEGIQVQQFDGNQVISSGRINTRADTITRKYIQLSIFAVLIVSMIVLLVRNYRKAYPESLEIKFAWKCFLSFALPVVVWLVQMVIEGITTDHHSDIFDFIGKLFIVYIITCPLFMVIVFWIKLRKQIDLLWYCLIFALAYTFFLEYNVLLDLLPIN